MFALQYCFEPSGDLRSRLIIADDEGRGYRGLPLKARIDLSIWAVLAKAKKCISIILYRTRSKNRNTFRPLLRVSLCQQVESDANSRLFINHSKLLFAEHAFKVFYACLIEHHSNIRIEFHKICFLIVYVSMDFFS